MARRSADGKAATHALILRHASEAFRGQGVGVGIGDIMKHLGLTHGGFYKHFRSKDDLLVEAISLGFSDVTQKLERVAKQAEPGHELEAIISTYLSREHLRNPQSWCVIATLAPEIARMPATLRKRIDESAHQYRDTLAKYMPGETAEARNATFLLLFSGMSGALALIRATGDTKMRDEMLTLTRDYYLSTFAPKAPS